MNETWKPVPGFIGRYEVSSHGRVRSVTKMVRNRWGSHTRSGAVLKPRPARHGYLRVALYSGRGVRMDESIHVLVALAFVDRPDGTDEVNHKDGDKARNHATNLEWSTRLENVRHSIRTGLRKRMLSDDQVRAVRAGNSVSGVSESFARHIRARRRYADIA